MNGFKKMTWDCEKSGCFNKMRRLDFGAFYECFPGEISMSDVDGIVEIEGNLLLMEWKKSTKTPLERGQRIMYERMSGRKSVYILVVYGSAETMEVEGYLEFQKGKMGAFVDCDINDLKDVLRRWAEWAKKTPYIESQFKGFNKP